MWRSAVFSFRLRSFSAIFGFVWAGVRSHLCLSDWRPLTVTWEPLQVRTSWGAKGLSSDNISIFAQHMHQPQQWNCNKFPAWFRYSDPSRCYRSPWCQMIQEHQRNEQKPPKRQSNQTITGCDDNVGRQSRRVTQGPSKDPLLMFTHAVSPAGRQI